MVIEIKMTNDQVFQLARMLNELRELTPVSKESKLFTSIGLELYDKVDAKAKKIHLTSSLFDEKKKHKFTFKYHQALALQFIIQGLLPTLFNLHTKTIMNALLSTINQKLA